jgi:hypothetical protein
MKMRSTRREMKHKAAKLRKAKVKSKKKKHPWKSYQAEMSRLTGRNRLTRSKSLTSTQIYFAVSSVMGMSSPLRSNNRAFSLSSKGKTLLHRLNPEQGKPVLSLSVSFRT